MYRAFLAMVGLAILGGAPSALGEQYFVSYEADGVYPEDAGWTRYTNGGGALRYFDDGALAIDSRDSIMITDVYAWWRPGELDPEAPGEVFVVQWRLRISALQGPWDPTLGIYSDDERGVSFFFKWDGVVEPHAGHVIATYEPGIFHEFEFRSAAMLTYDLYIDSMFVFSGDFAPPALNGSFVAWGDGTLGGASLAYWDYLRFGVVVPEPCSIWLVLMACLVRLKPRG